MCIWKRDTCLKLGKIDYMCPLTSIFVKSIFCCYIMPPNGLCPFRRLSLLICKCYWLNWHADDGMSSWFVKHFYYWCSIFIDNQVTIRLLVKLFLILILWFLCTMYHKISLNGCQCCINFSCPNAFILKLLVIITQACLFV